MEVPPHVDEEDTLCVVIGCMTPIFCTLIMPPRSHICDEITLVCCNWRSNSASFAFLRFLCLWCLCCADPANDGFRRILSDDIWWMDHVELFCGILASKGKDGKLATRVRWEEVGDVENIPVNHNPAIALRNVLGHFGHVITTASANLLFLVLALVLVIVVILILVIRATATKNTND